MSLFWKLVDETQISKPPEPAMSHNSMKLMVFLQFITIYFTRAFSMIGKGTDQGGLLKICRNISLQILCSSIFSILSPERPLAIRH
jgi:hypothetical protein